MPPAQAATPKLSLPVIVRSGNYAKGYLSCPCAVIGV